ncbi:MULTISPECIES: hypothetical protein [Colwellia]|uniref:Uncharacterized protein n=1 Tax=Colwellia marinimaniae TaxID=1513592 RepID=A0ABQ0N059_9GAMM|nr:MULTISPECIES: hypothetical protein [Colwellia]GAW97996.1 hypothetical protein MTCD1_03654 [Colwellia marinimaniae]
MFLALAESSSIEDGINKTAEVIIHGMKVIIKAKKTPAPAEYDVSESTPPKTHVPNKKAIKASDNPRTCINLITIPVN